jgi:hypothetical protein
MHARTIVERILSFLRFFRHFHAPALSVRTYAMPHR